MNDRKADNVFEGPAAIPDFLNPGNSQPLPLVELPEALNPFRGDGVRIFAKLACLGPLLNIKFLPAWNMLWEAQASGRLKGVHTLVENSSGNTVFDLAVLASLFGIRTVKAFVPFDIAPGKLELLRIAGVDAQLKRGAPGERSGIAEARLMGEERGFFCSTQYENETNPAAYEKWLAPEIWRQLEGRLRILAVGLGTTGTLIGCGRYFRKNSAEVTMVGCICRPNEAVPGVRSRERLKEIGFDWEAAADAVIEVGTRESFRLSLQLCRTGLIAGPSSGFALAGLCHFLESAREQFQLEQLRNDRGEIIAAFVCADTPLPYLDKYSTHLDAWEF